MREIDVLSTLKAQLTAQHCDEPGTLVLRELGLCNGEVLVDVAVVNGHLTGYEIKSDRDTLERLPRQVQVYGAALDFAHLVVGSRHEGRALELIPKWWGVTVAEWDGTRVALTEFRRSMPNPAPDPAAIVTFLWREEAWDVLVRAGATKGLSGKPRKRLYDRICEALTLDQIRLEVRSALKRRDPSRWRPDALRT